MLELRVALPMYRQVDKRNLQKQVILEPSSLLHTIKLEITKQSYFNKNIYLVQLKFSTNSE